MNSKNYYKILGVHKTTSEQDLKKAYYKLAKEWHPDKNKTAGAEEYFKTIKTAYETLADPSKRKVYDLQSDFTFTTTTTTTTASTPKTSSEKPKPTNFKPKPTQNSRYFKSEFNFDQNENNAYNSFKFPSGSRRTNRERPKWNNNWARDELDEEDLLNDFVFKTNSRTPFDLFEAIAIYKLLGKISTGMIFGDIDSFADLISMLNRQQMSSGATSSGLSGGERLPKMTPRNSRANGAKKDEEKMEFEWLGDRKKNQNRQQQQPKAPPSYSGSDNESEFDRDWATSSGYTFFSNASNPPSSRYFNSWSMSSCRYCSKDFEDRDILLKHEAICKRLSHNQNRTNPMTNKPKNSYNFFDDNEDDDIDTENMFFKSSSTKSSPNFQPRTFKTSNNQKEKTEKTATNNNRPKFSFSKSPTASEKPSTNQPKFSGTYTKLKREKMSNSMFDSK